MLQVEQFELQGMHVPLAERRLPGKQERQVDGEVGEHYMQKLAASHATHKLVVYMAWLR